MQTSVAERIVRVIVTHLHPHLDELFAIFLVKIFGAHHFKLTSDVSYGYISTGVPSDLFSKYPDHLPLGVGHGEYDDHGPNKNKEFSCCELVARKLGISKNYDLFKLLEAISHQDKNLSKHSLGKTFPMVINYLHRYGQGNYLFSDIQQWVDEAITALMASERYFWDRVVLDVNTDETIPSSNKSTEINRRFLQTERPWFYLTFESIKALIPEERRQQWSEFPQLAMERQQVAFDKARRFTTVNNHIFTIPSLVGEIKLVAIDGTANDLYNDCILEFNAASRLPEIGAGMTLIRDNFGHTLIAANKTFPGNLKTFVMRLRCAEAYKRRLVLDAKVVEQLGDEGTVSPIDSWFVHEGTNYMRIYSGSTTRPDIDLSVLTMSEILGLLVDWLSNVPPRWELIALLPMEDVQRRQKLLQETLTGPKKKLEVAA